MNENNKLLTITTRDSGIKLRVLKISNNKLHNFYGKGGLTTINPKKKKHLKMGG